MMPECWSLHEVSVWARWGCLEDRFRDLLRPHWMLWCGDQQVFARAFAELERALPPSRRHLLPQAVIAAALSQPAAAPAWVLPWLRSNIDLRELGLALPWETLLSMQWALFPIALADAERAAITYVLVGMGTAAGVGVRLPAWWGRVADLEAQASIAIISGLLCPQTERAFCFWPLLPFIDRLLVNGPSLALPFLLAARGLLGGETRRDVLASGKVAEDGGLEPVGGLALKAAAAAREGLSGFIHPRAPGPVDVADGSIERLEARSLQEAFFLGETFKPGEGAGRVEEVRMMGDPAKLAANALLLSEATLRWKGFEAAYRQQVEVLATRRPLLDHFLDNLERAMDVPDCAVNRLQVLLAPFSEERVQALAARHPLAAFRLAQLQLTVGSRQGHVAVADGWARLGNLLLARIMANEQGLELQAAHLNRKFVLHRHGRYDFRPDLPEAMMEVIEALTESARIRRRYHAGTVAPALGKLYGTIAQNYGFCGPAFLREVERCAALAQEAFGGGRHDACEEDWRRQFCYLVYALLDAGKAEAARQALGRYLGGPFELFTQNDYSALNRYQHAALARFLRETGETPAAYGKWSARQVFEDLSEHPWQLWLNNLGLAAQGPTFKKMVWARAVDQALSLGASARPMALLPLANLWQDGLWEDQLLEEKTREALKALNTPALCREHFHRYLKGEVWQEVLWSVLTFGDRLFPFSYR